MPDDLSGWQPPRPDAGARVWGAAASTPGHDVREARVGQRAPQPSPGPAVGAAGPGDRGRPGRGRRAAGAARRGSAYVGLIVVAALVAVGGLAATPRYGEGTAWGGTTVDDLRRAPGATSWSVDLAAALAPAVPRGCLHLWPSEAVDGLVAVGSSVDLDVGSPVDGTGCRDAAAADPSSRVALVDVAAGRVVWVHDLAREVAGTDPLSIPSSQVVPSAGRVLVQTQTTGSTVLVALDLADGSVLESTRGRRDLPSVSVATSGRLQLRTSTALGDSGGRYSLVDAGDLDHPVWEGRADVGTAPLLLPDGLVVVRSERARRVDGRTGQERPFGAAPDVVAVSPTDPGTVYALGRRLGGARTVSALDRSGEAAWSAPTGSRGLAVTPRCVVTTGRLDTAATCLDRRDGTTAWTTDLGGAFSVEAVPGQVGDDVYAVVQRDGDAALAALAGDDGHVRFRTPVGQLDTVVAASRTVVYLGTDDARSFPRGVTAFDAATGAELWTYRSPGTVSFWGGALVSIDDRGVARRLVDDTAVGRTS